MKREIGSEFWNGCTLLNSKGFDVQMTLCGRTALEIIIEDAQMTGRAKRVYMPSYCCHTMIHPFIKHGIEITFYDVSATENGFRLDFDNNNSADMVLLMDYFGFVSAQTEQIAHDQRQRDKILIYDATHSIFCKDRDYSDYDYVFASLRKYLPVNAGFCAKQTAWYDFPKLQPFEQYVSLREQGFTEKAAYVAGDSVQKETFLTAFSTAESMLETAYTHYAADAASLRLLETVDVENLRAARQRNARRLIAGVNQPEKPWLRTIPQTVSENDCPLFVPLALEPAVRDRFRSHMIATGVYLPIHWPVSNEHPDKRSSLYQTEISCICDQRYHDDDMDYIIHQMGSFVYDDGSVF